MHLLEQGVRKLACSAIIICSSCTSSFDWISPSTLLLYAAAWNKVYCDDTSCCCCAAVVNLLHCFPPSALPSTCNLLMSKLSISCHLIVNERLAGARAQDIMDEEQKAKSKADIKADLEAINNETVDLVMPVLLFSFNIVVLQTNWILNIEYLCICVFNIVIEYCYFCVVYGGQSLRSFALH